MFGFIELGVIVDFVLFGLVVDYRRAFGVRLVEMY